MSRIEDLFNTLKSENKKAIMPFVVAGDPSLPDTAEVIKSMSSAGANVIEIGIPFSDPIADGPVIAAAMHRALQLNVTPQAVMEMVSEIRPEVEAGLVAMVSHSIVMKSGGKEFVQKLQESGFDGLIVPDIDIESARELSAFCRSIDFAFTMLVAPTTTPERAAELANLSSGFLYVLARIGLTGEQEDLPDLQPRIESLRSLTSLPLAVGFGISTKQQISDVHEWADAAIVGSALVRRLSESKSPAETAEKFVLEIS